MKKYCIIVIAALSVISCNRKEIAEMRSVSLVLNDCALKTSLNPERTKLVWNSGDRISVYNDGDESVTSAEYKTGEAVSVSVPANASSVKVTFPETEGSYSKPVFAFPKTQTQSAAGTLAGEYYPIVAEARIENERATLDFSPVGSVFAVNAFNPIFTDEKIKSVSVRPSGMQVPVLVSLTQFWTLSATAPEDYRKNAGQVYACVERGSYSKVTFIVTTTRAVYYLTTNDTALDLQNNDFFIVNLNLKDYKVTVFKSGPGGGSYVEVQEDVTEQGSGFVDIKEVGNDEQLTRDTIPDFSTVGYRWGEKDFPDYSNVVQLPAPSGYDDTYMIQSAIDAAPERTVLQFQKGRYIIDSIIFIDKSYLILRGAGNKETEIFARGTVGIDDVDPEGNHVYYPQIRHLINMGVCNKADRAKQISESVANIKVTNLKGKLIENHPDAWYVGGVGMKSSFKSVLGSGTHIIEDAYCGSTFVTVSDASSFNVGDKVQVYRPATAKWIHDIKMDMIIKDLNDIGTITQWSPSGYGMYWERVIKAVHGNRLYFDAPLVMSITSEYGLGEVYHCINTRIKESGIENFSIVSDYNPERDSKTYGIGDIYHAHNAITIYGAEHCWVKDIQTKYFSSSAVAMSTGSKNITVQNCTQLEPAAYKRGGLRYAFHVNGGESCLIKDCISDKDRHQFVTAGKIPGPNVFLRCYGTNALSNIGPHQRWATGTLYDHVSTTKEVSAVDAGNSGTGQGWQGTSQVFWCCKGAKFYMQDPWVTGRNYAIGCEFIGGGAATLTNYNPYPNPGYAPDGTVVNDSDVNGPRINSVCRPLAAGEPEYLYDYQLAQRKARGDLVSNFVVD